MNQDEKIRRIDSAKDRSRAREKDSERLKVEENVFDVPTLKILYTLANKEIKKRKKVKKKIKKK
jgi:RIO kinase 1